MNDLPLFRPEALDAQRVSWHGEIVMAAPLASKALALFFGAMAAALIAFAVWGSYTKRVTVAGQLVPGKGLFKVYVQQTGTVIEEHVVEGQRVQTGDVLFVLSSERQSSTIGNTQAALSRDARAREQSLREELAKTQEMRRFERDSLTQKTRNLRAELQQLQGLIADQRTRYELAVADYRRYEGIESKGYVSQDQLNQKQADVIDQKARLESLERDNITTQRNLDEAQYQLDTVAIKYDNQIGDIERNITVAEQDLTESEARRVLKVIAPAPGTATAITAHLGQAADTNQPVVSILPDDSRLQAELYAPSRAVGFVKPGGTVSLRYQAYPYEKFGQYAGTVTAIASTSLSSSELMGSGAFSASVSQPSPQQSSSSSEPVYRITVQLHSQSILAFGEPRALRAGMLLEADLLQENRQLYQWVLEPLYSLSGKLQGGGTHP